MIFECISFSLSNIDWTAIGAIVTALMMIATFFTVYQNSKQLKELKRQWEENNRPRLFGRIIPYQHAFVLEIYNTGNQDAFEVEVTLNEDFLKNIPDIHKPIFENMISSPFHVKAGQSVYFLIGMCQEINEAWKDKNFNIEVKGRYNKTYPLDISLPIKHFINKIHLVVRTPIEKALEDISEGLVRPHLISKPKAIQLYLKSISESLEKISKNCNGTEQNK